LTTGSPTLTAGLIECLKWTKTDILNFEAVKANLEEPRRRLLGVAGYFTTNPTFRSETA